MKNGFKEVVDKILRKYGLRTDGCVGTVWSAGNLIRASLSSMGYRVEDGIDNPDYDYIILSRKKSTVENILTALTKVKVGCIIIFSAERISLGDFINLAKIAGSSVKHEVYSTTQTASGYGILGILFKGKEF
jgi:hypothetical protein